MDFERHGMARGWAALLLSGVAAAQTPLALPPEPVLRLSPEEAGELARAPRWLALRDGGFDTRGNEPALPEDLRAERPEGGGAAYFLVQFDGPVTRELRARVAATGAELLDYVPNRAFIARATPAQRAALERSLDTAWTGELHPGWRLEPRLRSASAEPALAAQGLELSVLGFRGAGRAEFEAALRASGAAALELYAEDGRWLARARGTPAIARRLARAADVQWVEPAPQIELRNNNVAWVVQTNVNLNTRVWDQGLHGEGQVIGHIDSPFSLTNCWFRDPAGTPVGPNHRKVAYFNGSGVDPHGSHTAGTAAADAQPVNGSTLGRGLAYLARLAHTDAPIASFSNVASLHAAAGARIHTNSWGDDTTSAYNALCASIDSFAWSNEEHLVVFSVSNSPFVTNPDNAKNLLAVSASQNGAQADNFCFGGQGPTADGRRRPEVLTPGCNVISVTNGTCATATLTGTSMSAPSAAAAAALVRQYFLEGFYPSGRANAADAFTPSGALLKAVLVNTSQDLTGLAGYPGVLEGWGRINLDESLHFVGDASKLFATELRHAAGLATGQDAAWTVHVQSSALPLEVTLAFTDAPGTVNAASPVVNDLDLEVTSPSGVLYLGNVFAGGWSVSGGSADPLNNVERVALAAPELGLWTLRVRGASVPQGPQGLGLCATGDISVGGTSSPTSYCSTSQTTNFCAPQMTTAGVARAGASAGFTLAAAGLEGQRQGWIFYGITGRSAASWRPGSTSQWCVRQPVQRTTAQSTGGALNGCNGLLALDWSAWVAAHPQALGAPFAPGQLVQAQAWFRDPFAPGQSNLSNAVEFSVQP